MDVRSLGVSEFNLPLRVVGLADSLRATLGEKLQKESFIWQTRVCAESTWPTPAVKSGWDDWCSAQEQLRFAYEVASVPRGRALELERPPVDECFAGYPADLVAHARSYESSADRSSFFQGYLNLKETLSEQGDQPPQSTQRQLKELYSWWNGAYLEVIAQQNRANWISFDRVGKPSEASRKARGHSFMVSGLYLSKMEALTPGAYGTVVSSIEESRKIFEKRLTARSLRGLVYSATECLTAPHRNAAKSGGPPCSAEYLRWQSS